MGRIRLSSRTALFGQDERYHQERLRALRGAQHLPDLPDDSVRAA